MAILERSDLDAACLCIFSPLPYPHCEGCALSGVPSPGIHGTQFVKEFTRIHVGRPSKRRHTKGQTSVKACCRRMRRRAYSFCRSSHLRSISGSSGGSEIGGASDWRGFHFGLQRGNRCRLGRSWRRLHLDCATIAQAGAGICVGRISPSRCAIAKRLVDAASWRSGGTAADGGCLSASNTR